MSNHLPIICICLITNGCSDRTVCLNLSPAFVSLLSLSSLGVIFPVHLFKLVVSIFHIYFL